MKTLTIEQVLERLDEIDREPFSPREYIERDKKQLLEDWKNDVEYDAEQVVKKEFQGFAEAIIKTNATMSEVLRDLSNNHI